MGHTDLLTAIAAALPLAALVIDTAGVVLASSAKAEATFGCPAGTWGVPVGDIAALDRVRGLRATIRNALSHPGHPGPADLDTVDLAGASVTCRLTLVRDTGIAAFLLTAEDRSEGTGSVDRRGREAANAGLRAANDELHAANANLEARLSELRDALDAGRHKDDFLAMLAHELRNPLAPILSAMQVIRRHPDNAEVVQRAREVVERQVRHQARLLDDLLDVSRITRGRITLRKASVDMRTAVSAAVEATRPMIDARRHTLTVIVPDAPLRLEADPTRLTQIVTNLLDNAAKYTDAGGHIDLTVQRDGTVVVLRVRDTGVGIPHDMQGRIFDVFTQIDAPIARSLGGLGLGLTLVRSLTELHGGSVGVTSDGPGRGSEFTVRLPIGKAEALPGVATPSTPTGRHVLVVEDNADAREMLRIALELDGHRVATAADGPSGVETALSTTPDLVLVDIGLPGMDGYAVAQRLRAALGDRVTLVALTGYGQSEDRRRTSEAGFDAHLVKPVDPDVLTRALATGFWTAA